MRKRFYWFFAFYTLVNIPTLIAELRYFYRWGSWYVHEPKNTTEFIFHALFQIAQFMAGKVFIMPFSILLFILTTIEIVKYIKNNNLSWRFLSLLFSLIAILFIIALLSFNTIMFLPIYWI